MARRTSTAQLISFGLERDAAAPPLGRQIYAQVRRAVLEGRLAPGMRLPSSRMLAHELGCSRNTVMAAVEQLLAEGYLEGRLGSGTFVSAILPDELLSGHGETAPKAEDPVADLPRISRRGAALASLSLSGPSLRRSAAHRRAFTPGLPDTAHFPFPVWGRLLGRLWSNPRQALLRHGETAGYAPLRQAIAEYLRLARGVRVEPEQVFITSGAQQSLDLAVRLLLDPGDAIWLEEPGYAGLRGPPLASGAKLVPIPVDREGLIVAEGRRRAPAARMAVVAPAHHYPLGVTLSLPRRLELLDWARSAGAWIVEDDFDSEYRYTSKPLASLQSLEPGGGRVIYLGSFSKVLFPSLRIGYLVAPPALVDSFNGLRAAVDDHPAIPLQPVLAAFIAEGHFAAHIRRMRTLYAARQDALLEAAKAEFDGLLLVPPQAGGLHLLAWPQPALAARMSDREASLRARENDIVAPPLSASFWVDPSGHDERPRQALILGYAAVTESEMRPAAARLAAALQA